MKTDEDTDEQNSKGYARKGAVQLSMKYGQCSYQCGVCEQATESSYQYSPAVFW